MPDNSVINEQMEEEIKKKYLMSLPWRKEERNFYQHLFSYSEFAWDTLNRCCSILGDVVFINVTLLFQVPRGRVDGTQNYLKLIRILNQQDWRPFENHKGPIKIMSLRFETFRERVTDIQNYLKITRGCYIWITQNYLDVICESRKTVRILSSRLKAIRKS